MAKKTNKYIGRELEWLEKQYQSLQEYVDDNPISHMRERVIRVDVGKGITKDQVVATIEQQIASVRATLKEMPDLLAAIQTLREKSDAQEDIILKGDQELPGIMRKKFQGQT